MPSALNKVISKVSTRIPIAIGGVFVLSGLIWISSRDGLASLYAARAAADSSTVNVDKAIVLNSSDADAHLLRGAILEVNDDVAAATREYEKATALRPRDYVLWLMFARGCELNGAREKAIRAARVAVRLAPFYAQPHWQLGNLLVRDGQTMEGFKELRVASSINPNFLSSVIDLAWQLSKGDVQFVKNTIRPETAGAYSTLAEYFANRGRIQAAIEMFQSAGNDPQITRLRQQVVAELIGAKKFKEAYLIWSAGAVTTDGRPAGENLINDGGFESLRDFGQSGFQWRADRNLEAVNIGVDTQNPRDGRNSLHINYQGSANVNLAAISQLVLVDGGARYRLTFWVKTRNLISGGPPLLSVRDAGRDGGPALAQSATFPKSSNDWQQYALEFVTSMDTTAIEINITRQPCAEEQCPIFGDVWLDSFTLQKIPGR